MTRNGAKKSKDINDVGNIAKYRNKDMKNLSKQIEIHDLGESDKAFLVENAVDIIDEIENEAFEVFEQQISKYSLSSYMVHSLNKLNTLSVYTEDHASQTKLLYYWRVLSMAFYKLAYKIELWYSINKWTNSCEELCRQRKSSL